MGFTVQGYRAVLMESLLSVPGCILWIEPPKTVITKSEIVGGLPVDKVVTVASLSGDGYTWATQDFGNYRRPVLVSNYFTGYEGSSVSALLRRTEKDVFKCLQDGSPNGVYYISSHELANTNSISTPLSVSDNMTVSSTVIPGIRICTEIDTDNRRRVYKQLTDNLGVLIYESRTLNAMIIGIGGHAKVSYGFLNTGNGNSNNERLYANNGLLNQHTNTVYDATLPSASTRPVVAMCTRHPGTNKDIRNYLAVAYNWTGFTEADVLTFHLRVSTLVEAYKATL